MRALRYVKFFSALSETFLYDSVVELAARGVDTTVATMERRLAVERPWGSVELVDEPPQGGDRRVSLESMRRQLEAIARRCSADIVHAEFGQSGVLLAPVAESLSLPLIVSFHGVDAFALPRREPWASHYRSMWSRPDVWSTAVTGDMAGHLVALGAPPDRVAVIRSGKRVRDFQPAPVRSPVRNWLSVGRLVPKKGHADCIAAFERAAAEIDDASLTIAGGGCERDALSGRAVTVVGAVPHARVLSMLADCDAFALCSKTAGDGDREGAPNALMEAMACGRICVSTRHGGIPELFPADQRDLLAESGDVVGISERMAMVMALPADEIADRGARLRDHLAKVCDLDTESDKLLELYRDILAARGSR